MGLIDKMKKAAQQAASVASSTATKVAKKATESMDAVSSASQSAYDAMCEYAAQKIKGMLRGIDLQFTINTLNKFQRENNKDVSALVNFIEQLKIFSEDGQK